MIIIPCPIFQLREAWEMGKTIELDFVAEGKPSWLIVNGLSKEEARAGGTDPKIELFNKNEKMVGVSDNWRDENSSDQINNLENFPPAPRGIGLFAFTGGRKTRILQAQNGCERFAWP